MTKFLLKTVRAIIGTIGLSVAWVLLIGLLGITIGFSVRIFMFGFNLVI